MARPSFLRLLLVSCCVFPAVILSKPRYDNSSIDADIVKKTLVNKLATRGFGRVLTWNVKKLGACLRQDNVAPLKEAVCVVLQSANLIVLQEASNLDFSCLPCNTVLKDEYDWPGEGSNDEFKVLVKTRHSRSFSLKKVGSCESLDEVTTKRDTLREEENPNIYQTVMRGYQRQAQKDERPITSESGTKRDSSPNELPAYRRFVANERNDKDAIINLKKHPLGKLDNIERDSKNDKIALDGLNKKEKSQFIDFIHDVLNKTTVKASKEDESDVKLSHRQIQRFHTDIVDGAEASKNERFSLRENSNEEVNGVSRLNEDDAEKTGLRNHLFSTRERLYNTAIDNELKRERFRAINDHLLAVEKEIDELNSKSYKPDSRFKMKETSRDNGMSEAKDEREKTKSSGKEITKQKSVGAEEPTEKQSKGAERESKNDEGGGHHGRFHDNDDARRNDNKDDERSKHRNRHAEEDKDGHHSSLKHEKHNEFSKSTKQTFQDIMNSEDNHDITGKSPIFHQYDRGYHEIDGRAVERPEHEIAGVLKRETGVRRNNSETRESGTMIGKDELKALNMENVNSQRMHKMVGKMLSDVKLFDSNKTKLYNQEQKLFKRALTEDLVRETVPESAPLQQEAITTAAPPQQEASQEQAAPSKEQQPETVEPVKSVKLKDLDQKANQEALTGEQRIVDDKTFSTPQYLAEATQSQKQKLNYVIYTVKSDLNSGETFVLANVKLPKGKQSQRACMAQISSDISNLNSQSEEKYKKIIAGDFHMDRLSGSDQKGELYKILTNLQIDGENYHSPLTYGEKDPITTVYGRRFDNIIANLALKGNLKAIGPDFPLEPEAVVMPFILQRLYNNYMTSLYTSDNDESDSIYECIKAFQMAGKSELQNNVCKDIWTPSSYISDHLPLELRVSLKVNGRNAPVELRLASWNIQGDSFKERLLDPDVKRGFMQRLKKYHMAVFHEFPPHDRILDDQELGGSDIVRLKQGDLTTEFGIYISEYIKDGETDMYVLRKKFKGEDVSDVLINPTKEESENMVTTVGLFSPRIVVDTYKLQPCFYTVRTSEKQRSSGIDFEKIISAIEKDIQNRKCDFKLLMASLSLEDDFDIDKVVYDKFKFINLKCQISDGEMKYKYNVPRSRDLADYIIMLGKDPSIEFSECKIGLPGDEGKRGIDKLSDFEELTTHYPYSVVLKRTD